MSGTRHWDLGRTRWGVIILLLAVLGLVPVYASPTNSDLAWYQYMAARWLEGADLYRDLVEVNPPLIVWLNVPPAAAERVAGLSASAVYPVWVLVLTGLSLGLMSRSMGKEESPGGSQRRLHLLILFAFALVAVPGMMFVLGQREHLMLVLVLPYLVLAAGRIGGSVGAGSQPRTARIASGVLGGLGFALKPHFLLVLVAVEALVWLRKSGRWRLSPELLAAAATVVAYGSTVMVIHPEALGVARRFASYYAGHRQMGFMDFLTRWETLFTSAAVVLWVLRVRTQDRSPLGELMVTVAVVGLGLAWLQGMGWSYHFTPAVGAGTIVTGLVALDLRRVDTGVGKIASGAAAVLLGVLLLRGGVVAWTAATSDIEGEGRIEATASLMGELAPEGRVVVLSPQIGSAFPLVNRAGVHWGIRYPSLWVLTIARGVESPEPGDADAAETLPGRVRRDVVSDMLREPPDLILVDERAVARTLGDDGFDYLEYFAAEEGFETLMTRYERLGRRHGYLVLRRDGGS